MVIVKFRSRRSLFIGNGDNYGLNSLECTQIKKHLDNINALCNFYSVLRKYNKANLTKAIQSEILDEYRSVLQIIIVDDPIYVPRSLRTAEILTFDLMAQKLLSLNVEVSERFRFQSFNHLKRICDGFRFPKPYIVTDHGYKAGTEEMLMISLTRLSFPYRWSDLLERFPGRKR